MHTQFRVQKGKISHALLQSVKYDKLYCRVTLQCCTKQKLDLHFFILKNLCNEIFRLWYVTMVFWRRWGRHLTVGYASLRTLCLGLHTITLSSLSVDSARQLTMGHLYTLYTYSSVKDRMGQKRFSDTQAVVQKCCPCKCVVCAPVFRHLSSGEEAVGDGMKTFQ